MTSLPTAACVPVGLSHEAGLLLEIGLETSTAEAIVVARFEFQ